MESQPISKNEQKRLAKLAKKQQNNPNFNVDDNLTEGEKYELLRKEKLGNELYPPIGPFKCTTTLPILIKSFNYLVEEKQSGAKTDGEFTVAGRIMLVRKSSKNLYFFTITSENYSLQIVANFGDYNDKDHFTHIMPQVGRGDIISAKGFMGTTKINEAKMSGGELSLYVTKLTILAPCLKLLTSQHVGLTDIDMRAKNRHLDMILNPKVIPTLKTRGKILKTIRNYLDNLEFTEVQTPILTKKIGGANAQPFATYHNALKQDMFLRIAPELYLKQLVIGGLERVYEIGCQFRNESIDGTHVPEFTSMEFYMAYADYNDMMKICEDLLSHIVMEIHNSYELTYNKNVINFNPPFKRINILDELENLTGVKFPIDLSTLDAEVFLDNLCTNNGIECGVPRTANRLLDKLIGHYIEPQCMNPTFLIGHPMIMSPLAKANVNNPQIADRFELFANCFELANAYTEQNDADMQRTQFQNQQKDRDNGDDEAPIPDEDYIEALKCGLPPTGGFGMGIDRFVMLLTDNDNIREVISFPPSK